MHYKPALPIPSLAAALLAAVLAVPSGLTFAAAADTAFLAARDAFRNGERVRLVRQVDALRQARHPLQPWAEYWVLRQRLEEGDDSGVTDFILQHAGSYLADRLRGDWLRQLGKSGDWERFRRELPALVQRDTEIDCHAAVALDAPQALRPLWTGGQELPAACGPALERLVAAGGLSVEDVWQRMRRLFEARKAGAARDAGRYLPADQGFAAFAGRELEAIVQTPARHLDRLPEDWHASRAGREIVLFALQRVSRSDPRDAAARLERLEARLSVEERAYAWGQAAWQAALRHLPEALAWFEKAAATALSEEQLAWRARAALRAHDWAALRRAVAAMPPAMAAQPEWTYWLGRALAAQNRVEEARALYVRIAGQPHFYGNLADEELGRPIAVPAPAAPPSREELAAAAGNPGFQRAVALMRLDLRVEGVREWAWSIRGMDDRQLLAAAEFARRNELWDRAIHTADRTREQHDFGLRFVAPFLDRVEPKARELDLDHGWVYGLMRQESRFVMNARSSVGASGLMQLMPATAKWVAKKIDMKHFRPGAVNDLDVNVTLGTNYLKMVLDSLDNHPVLASAAYNAGPGRAKRWRAERPLEGAIYAETIPFSETRDYVKKVMSNAVYYNALFEGRPQSLKARLGVVRPQGQGERGVETLP